MFTTRKNSLMSQISPHIYIVVMGPDSKIYECQQYANYLSSPNSNIQSAAYGNGLINLLLQEGFLTEKLIFKQIHTQNPYADAVRLTGNIAEALVVEYCNKYPEINRTLACYARCGEREHKNLDNYFAIGTASKVTHYKYLQHYNPHDTQHDIIWVDKTDVTRQLACVGGTGSSVKPAGIQIKVSTDGLSNVLPDICHYDCPILYFDLKDDWYRVKSALREKGISATLINSDEISLEIKKTLKAYFDLILQLRNGSLTIEHLIEIAKYYQFSPLLSGIAASSSNADRTIILSS